MNGIALSRLQPNPISGLQRRPRYWQSVEISWSVVLVQMREDLLDLEAGDVPGSRGNPLSIRCLKYAVDLRFNTEPLGLHSEDFIGVLGLHESNKT